MKQFKFIFTLFFLFSFFSEAQTPERFINHRVSRNESLKEIVEQYGILENQLLEYNPLVERVGIKRRMNLRIPVYAEEIQKKEEPLSNTVTTSTEALIHLVAPKETK